MQNPRRDGGYGSHGSYESYMQSQQAQQQGQQPGSQGTLEYLDGNVPQGRGQAYYQSYQAYGQNASATQGSAGSQRPKPSGMSPPMRTATSAYNPANYASPNPQGQQQSALSPQISMPAGNYAAAYATSHTPYNPAAYQNPSPQPPQGTFGYQAYNTSSPIPSYDTNQTPPLPPKPPELTQQSNSPYPQPASDRRGAVYANPSYQSNYGPTSPPASYAAYTPPAPPPPPTFQPSSPSASRYQAYSPPLPQGHHPPSESRHRLPSIPLPGQEGSSPPASQTGGRGWAPRVQGQSLPSSSQGHPHQLSHRPSSGQSTQSRPLPPPPEDSEVSNFGQTNGDSQQIGTQDAIMAEIEAAVMGGHSSQRRSNASETQRPGGHSANGSVGLFPTSGQYDAPNSGQHHPGSGRFANHAGFETDSDAEATAGLHAMQLAEQDDGNRGYHRSMGSVGSHQSGRAGSSAAPALHPSYHAPPAGESSEDEMAIPMDISMGFDPGMGLYNYGHGAQAPSVVSPHSENGVSQPSRDSSRRTAPSEITVAVPNEYPWGSHDDELVSPTMITARVDRAGTGGLAEPGNARRMSFDDGDEATLVDYGNNYGSGTFSPTSSSDGYPRGPGIRPLPPTPQDDVRPQRHHSHQARYGADDYETSYLEPDSVKKANSMGSHAHGSTLTVPGRSVTDAEQRRKGNRASWYEAQAKAESAFPGPELDLPAIPDGRRRKFVPSKLSSKDFAECSEPWAISSILTWVKVLTQDESELRKQPIIDAIIGLFTHKVPTMNTADAELLSANLVYQMIHEAALVEEEEWVKFSGVKMSGVIFQLTGTGCYSSRVHTETMQGRCYSHFCMRTLKKIDLQAQHLPPERKVEDWVTFYKLKKEDIEGRDKKEIEVQNNLHEIVTSEDYYLDQLDVLLVLYRDGLEKGEKPILALTGKQSKFISEVFDKVPAVRKTNEDNLLPQLKYRQQEQGPWIVGFSDIFREWVRKAKTAYIDYATGLPNAIFQVKQQIDHNPLFKQFLNQVQEHPRSKRLDWNTYLKAPITRLQRYGLLLETVRKNMRSESQEKSNLEIAIREIKEVTLECDAKVAEMTRRTDIADLNTKLKLRPGMEHVQLNLTFMGRQIIHRGDLTRRGNNNINWVETHAILFDHYMVLSKVTRTKDSAGGLKAEYYDVSKKPIPMDLLVLESADDGIVMKHSVKGIVPLGTTPVSRPSPTPGSQDLRLVRTSTASNVSSPPPTNRSNSSPSGSGPGGAYGQTLDVNNENIMYPFRVQHLGKLESYVLYASSAKARSEWAEKIIFAKKQHAAGLHAQNAEPFKLRILADSSFAYGQEANVQLPVYIPGTPLDRALRDLERVLGSPDANSAPICRSAVNCAASFTPPFSNKSMLAVGTDFGVFITEQDSPRGWYKAINAQHVSQMQVMEDFSILLIIADKALIAFHLDAVVPPSGSTAQSENSSRRTPQKLSGNKDVGFFAVGKMKERMLVFYKKKDGISSTFKVLEPVYQKSATASSSSSSGWGRSRFGLKKGNTDFFRDFDDFYIATDTYAINLFASSLAIATSKGIEVLTLDKKFPFSIPDLRPAEVQSIAQQLQNQRPLGMFRLTDTEFLLAFEEVGIYVDKHGDISRAVVMEFVGKARQAALHQGTYLILVDHASSFVEVRNAMNGRLRQVIPGKDVKMLDDGMAGGASSAGVNVPAGTSRGSIKIGMQHPEIDKGYIILELVVNEGVDERDSS